MMSFAETPFCNSPSISFKRLRLFLQQALSRQHMLHFGCADAKRQRAKCAMRGSVAIAADNRHAGLSQTEFGSDHMNDAAIRREVMPYN